HRRPGRDGPDSRRARSEPDTHGKPRPRHADDLRTGDLTPPTAQKGPDARRRPRAPTKQMGPFQPSARLADVLAEELDGALAGLTRARLVEGAALVAAEAVAGRVDVHRDLRVLSRDAIPVVLGDRLVGLAEMEHHRALGLLAGGVGHAAAVERRRGGHAVDPRGGQPRDRAAEAVADHADLEPGLLQLLHRGLGVADGVLELQLATHHAAPLDVGGLIAGLET